jgi:hypothetical protein
MRKKLVSLGFALAALAVVSTSATASAAAKSCPPGTYEFTCGSFTGCCHIGALCPC